MTLEFDSMPPPPNRRFGPVTLLALAGGVVMGLLGVAVAWASGYPELMRGILVSFVFLGAMGGVVAGTFVERRQQLPIRMRNIPWHWFRFNMRSALVVTTLVAIYCGVGAVWGRSLRLGAGDIMLWLFIQQLPNLPRLVACFLAAVVFVNRWRVHPRVSRFGLAAIAGILTTELWDPLYGMYITSRIAGGSIGVGWLWYCWYWLGQLISLAALVLLFMAALVDRERKPPVSNREPDPDALA